MASRKEELLVPRAARGTSPRRSDGWVTVTSRKVFRSDVRSVRPVHQSRIGLFSFRPESQPLQLASELIAKLVVALGPCARIAEAEGRMFAFRIIPTSGVPSTASTVAARSSFRIQGKSQPEAS